MAVLGQVVTRDLELESRQHDLLGKDLGRGPTRRAFIIGAASLVIWVGLCFLIFGLPNKYSFTLYFLPPIMFTMVGSRKSTRCRRRMNLTNWVLAIRYAMFGHRPLIRRGVRQPDRRELLPLKERWHIITHARERLVPNSVAPPWVKPTEDGNAIQQAGPVGKTIKLRQRPVVISGQEMLQRTIRANAKTNKKKSPR